MQKTMSHTDVRIEKPKEFEINKKLRTIDERLNELENMSQLDFMKLKLIKSYVLI